MLVPQILLTWKSCWNEIGVLQREENKPTPSPREVRMTGGSEPGSPGAEPLCGRQDPEEGTQKYLRGTAGSVTDHRDKAGITRKWVVIFMVVEGLAFHL